MSPQSCSDDGIVLKMHVHYYALGFDGLTLDGSENHRGARRTMKSESLSHTYFHHTGLHVIQHMQPTLALSSLQQPMAREPKCIS